MTDTARLQPTTSETPAGPSPTSSRLRSVLVGSALLAVGLLGLLLPILPGWILIFAGLVVIAGAVPPLRRFTSRMVASRHVQKVVNQTAKTTAGRKMVAKAMAMPDLRRGLNASSRWKIIHTLLHQARRAAPESASREGHPS